MKKQKQKQRILITGGTGFLGYNLTERLIEEGFDVTVFFRGKKEILKKFDNVKYVTGNLKDEKLLVNLLNKNDVCFHLVSFKKNFKYHTENPADVYINNLEITTGFLRAVSLSSIKKIIAISSATVYSESNKSIKENFELKNYDNDAYAISKINLETGLKFLSKQKKNISICIARCDNFFGEFDNFGVDSQVVPSLIRKVIHDEIITIWGSGNQKRTFIYVKDVVDALVAMLTLKSNFEIFNISGSDVFSISDVVKIIQKILNTDKKIEFDLTKPEGVSSRIIDSSKIKKITKWKQKYIFKDGISNTIKYYKTLKNKTKL